MSFFSDKASKEAAKRGYTNVFLGLLLAFALLWSGFVGAEMLPFSARYNASSDFRATVHGAFANEDADKRISIEMQDGRLMAKKADEEYAVGLLTNTFDNEDDREAYSQNGYDLVIDTRPADALAEVEIYYISNDGENLKISYEEYLSLSAVARLNFDFKLRYTGNELVLDDATVGDYKAYLVSLGDDTALEVENLTNNLAEGKITKDEFDRAIYQLYFTNYYPDISDYESTSKVPLLRNYYYHQYIKAGKSKYLFIFDDYLTGSFETDGGMKFSFYGFYSNLEDGELIDGACSPDEAERAADDFIKKSFRATTPLTLYAHAMNVFSFIPFIALMPMVVTLLAYSILKLRGVESITSLGGTFKIIGSYVWFSAVIAAALSLCFSFFTPQNLLTTLPLLLFFVALAARAIVFAVREAMAYERQLEKQETKEMEA